MKSDKEIKKEFKEIASKDPDKYYATGVLKKEGYMRKRCKCGTYFWTVNADQEVCGDPACSGGFRFIGKTPVKKEMDYIETWKEFSRLFTKLGYTPIKRYPVVARWRSDTEFVQASIYDFQPYVVNGMIEPPANPLVVPQFCLRFNDIDNVGITGAHYSGFIMIGQHAFMPKERWSQEKFFRDIYTWLRVGLGLPKEEITFHEDAWAGGGNFGPCMEYFSRGLELGNQVYMMFEQTPSGNKELGLKVLDMGMGHERNAWFSQGTSTSYETTFPTVCKKLFAKTGVTPDPDIMKKFLPYASYLNSDEVDDIDKVWSDIAEKISIDVKELKDKIIPLSAVYSIGEHSRALLFALSDGALPSNVGGGYNLRVILRRALSFIDKYGWDISLPELCRWHADYLEPLFPELKENLLEVVKILDIEKKKYYATKKKSRNIIRNLLSKGDISVEKLLSLYDSQGITPEFIKSIADEMDKEFTVPDNFYSLVSGRHEIKEQIIQKKDKLALKGISDTEILYYDHYDTIKFKGTVEKIIDDKVILDRTIFYPTSGGQAHDLGTLGGINVKDVYKEGSIVVHVLEHKPEFKEGDVIDGNIDFERRLQLAQHHTATHIINGCARKILGNHIWQAGANKDIDKARLDITHYEALSPDIIQKIEKMANKIIDDNLPVYSTMMKRNIAEAEYGFRLYQGGAVPGKMIRVVNIEGFDVEACGGTHLDVTSEVKLIKILHTSKIQDGIVRIEFSAGNAAVDALEKKMSVIQEAARLLDCQMNQVPGRAAELFKKWKKAVKKKKAAPEDFILVSEAESDGDLLQLTAKALKTQTEHINNTLKRFKKELEEAKDA